MMTNLYKNWNTTFPSNSFKWFERWRIGEKYKKTWRKTSLELYIKKWHHLWNYLKFHHLMILLNVLEKIHWCGIQLYFFQSENQPSNSYDEQKLSVKHVVSAIDQYRDYTRQSVFITCRVISGSPGVENHFYLIMLHYMQSQKDWIFLLQHLCPRMKFNWVIYIFINYYTYM